jgi:hypothetical protein
MLSPVGHLNQVFMELKEDSFFSISSSEIKSRGGVATAPVVRIP